MKFSEKNQKKLIIFQRRKSFCNIEKKDFKDEEDVFSFKGKDEVEIKENNQISQTLHLHLFCFLYKSVTKLLLSTHEQKTMQCRPKTEI